MKRINVIGGVPRGGSTLLCNLMSQNPKMFASDTSGLAITVHTAVQVLNSRNEFKSELGKANTIAPDQMGGMISGMVQGYYSPRPEQIIFDKDRTNTWLYEHQVFHGALPNGVIFLLARDPREILASRLRHQAKNPLLRNPSEPNGFSTLSIADKMFSPQGLVGAAMAGIEEIIRLANLNKGSLRGIRLIQYERFVADPESTVNRIYEALNEPIFDHDFNNVVDVSGDNDSMYSNLWPHKGSGKIQHRQPTWPTLVSADIAQIPLQRYPLYCSTFGYI